MPTVVKVNHLLLLSLSFCHLLYPTEHEEHLDLRAVQGWVHICLSRGGGLVFMSDHWKVYFRGDWSQVSMDGEHKVRPRERAEIEPLALPKVLIHLLWINQPIILLSLFQVWGSYQRTPTPTLPLAPSFLSLASFFFFFAHTDESGIMSSPPYLWSHDSGNESKLQVLPSTSLAFHFILFKSLWFFFFFHFLLCQDAQPPPIHQYFPPHYSSDRGQIFFNRALYHFLFVQICFACQFSSWGGSEKSKENWEKSGWDM